MLEVIIRPEVAFEDAGNDVMERLWGSFSPCDLVIDGRLLELEGDRVLGDELLTLPGAPGIGAQVTVRGNLTGLASFLPPLPGLLEHVLCGLDDMGDTESVVSHWEFDEPAGE